MKKRIFIFLGLVICCYTLSMLEMSCAQVGYPTGGLKDSLPPVLTKASPEIDKLNFKGNRITLNFDEYIDIQDIQSNLIVSPLPKTNPTISSNLKVVSIKLKDTLLPNTTYSINFGNAIVDVHEGIALKNFTYTFSTGNFIDSMHVTGKVILAETGKTDSTLLVLLYKNAVDTEVTSRKPDYATRVDGKGNFIFTHLPAASFKIYALKDGDGGKTYNSKTETFAFSDNEINTAEAVRPVTLFAYNEEKPPPTGTKSATTKKAPEKKLRYSSSISGRTQDLLEPLQINFTTGLQKFDSLQIVVSDTNFKALPNVQPTLDSTRKKISIGINWQPETEYRVIIHKEGFEDSTGLTLEKSDTIRFITKKEADYGKLLIRFRNIDLTKHPVIQFLQNDAVRLSAAITTSEWTNNRFPPGEYDVRILYDTNNNGLWDPGNYTEKLQPERAVSLPQKLAIKADWENEREIQL